MKTFTVSCLIFGIIGFSGLQADETYKVSAVPAPAHIFLEEFTGAHCSYCPQAHAIANNLTYLYPDKVHVMAVHTGSLAIPSGDEPDLRYQPYGDSLYAWSGQGGMPSGDINRTVYPESFEGRYTMPRSEWMRVARRLLTTGTPAPVNLHAQARLSGEGSEAHIYIDVEAFAVEGFDRPLFLHVALTENFVPGVQAGGGLATYLHRHVLRELVTGLNGDTLRADELTQGAYLRRSYTYTLPEEFVNRKPNKANLACVVFVSESDRAVLNSTEAEVESAVKAPLEYLQINLHGMDKLYVGNTYDVYVVNPSDDTVRSLTFAFTLNRETRTYTLQDLCVRPKTETTVRLETDFPVDSLKGNNLYALELTQANGVAVKANRISSNFKAPLTLPEGCTGFKIAFAGDNFGSENTVALYNGKGECLYEAGPFADGTVASCRSEVFQPEAGEVYVLHVTESFRDGLDKGDIRILTDRDSVWYQSYVGTYGHKVAFRMAAATPDLALEDGLPDAQPALSVTPNPADADVELRLQAWEPGRALLSIYNLQGRLIRRQEVTVPASGTQTMYLSVADYPQGFYFVRMEQAGRHGMVKLVVRH